MKNKMDNQTSFEFCTELQEGYNVVSNTIYHCGLTYGAIGMYTAILMHKNQNGWKVYQSTLVTAKDGRTKVSNYMKELMEVGLVDRIDIRENGRFKGYKYTIYAKPTKCIVNSQQEETFKEEEVSVAEQLKVEDYPECCPPKSVLPTSVELPLENKDTNKIKKEKIKKEKKVTPKVNEIEKSFEEIWSMYPKKLGKQKAKKSFIKFTKKDYTIDQMRKAVVNYLNIIRESGTNEKYIIQGGNFFTLRFEDYLESDMDTSGTIVLPEQEKRDNLFDDLFN